MLRTIAVVLLILWAPELPVALSAEAPKIKDSGSAATHAADVAKREIKLADRMSANDLKRLIKDLPGTFDLVDIRPADQFADYNIPGSRNVGIADLLGNPAYLTGAGPLIIVDRDGSLAMQVAGILSQKAQRSVKSLYGGLEAYWKEAGLKDVGKPMAIPSKSGPAQAPQGEAPKVQSPQPPKKKSAGC